MAEAIDIRELNIRIEQQSQFVTNLVMGMNKVIVGQKHLVDCLLIGLLSDGHILLEGVPGLAKTLAIKTLSQLISSDYSRIQFTPDLLPADVVGTQIYSQKDEAFHVKRGGVGGVAHHDILNPARDEPAHQQRCGQHDNPARQRELPRQRQALEPFTPPKIVHPALMTGQNLSGPARGPLADFLCAYMRAPRWPCTKATMSAAGRAPARRASSRPFR